MAGFSVFKRTSYKGNSVYFVQFKKPDGSYTSAKSTGCATKKAAIKWAQDNQIKNGHFLPGHDVTLSDYSKGFFDYKGQWATNKKVMGRRISEAHCLNQTANMRVHVIPALGHLNLTELNKLKIREFRNNLFKAGYSGSLINKCLYAIKAILEEAEEQGLIPGVPRFEKAADNPSVKGILTIEEVNRLFSFTWMSKPTHCHPSRPQYMGYVGNLIAASTGIRLGELQAITIQDLHLPQGYISIRRSWDNKLNRLNETTKTGKVRNIFIPVKIREEITNLLSMHPFPDNPEAFLFRGDLKPDEKPCEKKVFIKALYTAFERIGIDKAERKRRNITFHSWRHFMNSLMINARIPVQKIQSITGHSTSRMMQHYYHVDDMKDVLAIQEGLFSN